MNITIMRTVAVDAVPGLSLAELERCRLPVDFPFLVHEETQEIIEPVFRFMWARHVKSGNFRLNTANADADDLKDWLQYLVHFGTPWNQAERSDLEHYRDLMFTLVSPKTHEPYSDSTISRRVGTVQQFYRHFNAQGITSMDVGDRAVDVRRPLDQSPLAHARRTNLARTNEVQLEGVKSPGDGVRAMTAHQYRLIAQALGPTPNQHLDDPRPVRDRLRAELCVHTGMRPGEPERLTVYSILDLTPEQPDDPCGLTMLSIVGKGNKKRKVALPNQVLSWLIWYIENERADAIKEGRRRGHISKQAEPKELFLNGVSTAQHVGKPATYNSFNEAFAKAVRAAAQQAGRSAGLMTRVTKVEPLTREPYVVSEPRFTPHCLRHTFSVWFYVEEKRQGNPEPWKELQALLGHSSLVTTVNTYLRVAHEFEAQISDRITGHLAALLRTA